MSDKIMMDVEARKRRVRRLKKYVIAILIICVTIPMVICFHMHAQLRNLQRNLQQMQQEYAILAEQMESNAKAFEGLKQTVADAENRMCVAEVDTAVQKDEPVEATTGRKKVYITFDDGPSSCTKEILDILDSYQVKATFFVVGKEADWAKELLCEIVDRGHSLGMHSYSHKYSELYRSVEGFEEDFEKLQSYLYEVTGVESNIYRFPGGSSNQVSRIEMKEFIAVLEEKNVVYYDWNVSSGDASNERLSVDQILRNVMQDVGRRETSIILFHDAPDKRTTVEALPVILEKLMEMDDIEILPITDDTEHIQHVNS